MGITIGDAVLWLTADDSKLDAGLQAAQGKANGWLSGMGGIVATGLGAVVAGVGAAVGGLTAFGVASVKGNAQFETYLTQFGVLLGDADAAKKRLEDLAAFGAKTPFELPQVVEADKILQGFGLHSEEAAKKFGFTGEEIRTIAGDVASGAGVSFQEMAGYIGKFSSGATGEVIARFQELGIMTRDQMKGMGLEFSKSGELLSPLPEATNTVLQMMKEKYGGMMDAQSQTFDGMVSNVQDWIGQTTRKLGQPIFEKVKEKLGLVLTWMNSPEVQGVIDKVATGIGSAIDRVMEFVDNFEVGMGTNGDVINGLVNALFGLEDISPIFTNIGEALSGFELGLEATTTAGTDLDNSGIANTFVNIGVWVRDAASSIGGFITGQLIPFINEHGPAIKGAIEGIGIALLAITAGAVILEIAAGIAALANPITLIIALAALLGAAWAEDWGGIREKTAEVIGWIQNSIIIPFVAWFNDFWAAHGEQIKSIASGMWEGVKALFEAFKKGFENIFSLFSLAFQGKWTEFGQKLRSIWDETWTKVKQMVTDAIEAIKKVDWPAVGDAILKGIGDGIKAGWKWLENAARDAAKAALDAAKGFLQINTPSKKFAREVGEPIAEGIGVGYQTKMRSVANDIGGSLSGLAESLGGGYAFALPQPVQFIYAPMISTADRYEAEQILEPIVNSITRRQS